MLSIRISTSFGGASGPRRRRRRRGLTCSRLCTSERNRYAVIVGTLARGTRRSMRPSISCDSAASRRRLARARRGRTRRVGFAKPPRPPYASWKSRKVVPRSTMLSVSISRSASRAAASARVTARAARGPDAGAPAGPRSRRCCPRRPNALVHQHSLHRALDPRRIPENRSTERSGSSGSGPRVAFHAAKRSGGISSR
jgi:hypothetical protein